jgi:hypothetical protein
MWERIKQFTQPPVFSDNQAKTRQARMLNDILLINLLAVLVGFVVSLAVPTPTIVSILICLYIFIIILLRLSIKRGAVKQASYVLVLLFLGGVTAVSAALGTNNSAVNSYYILAIVIAGLLLDSKAMAWTCVLSFLGITGLRFAGSRGWLPPASPNNSLRDWLTMLVIFANTALFIHLTRLRYLEELRQRQQAEQSAKNSEARFRQLYIAAQRKTQEMALLEQKPLQILLATRWSQYICWKMIC